jgi:hypothetical protein
MRRRQAFHTAARRTGSSQLSIALLVAAVVAMVALAVTACGGSSGSPSTTTPSSSSSVSPTTTEASLSPGELGNQIGATYVGALRDAALALKDKPDVAAVRAQIEQLKNDTVAKLVEFGRAREAMNAGDRASVDAKITAALSAAGAEDWYATYNDVWQHYSSIDTDFANLVAAFNVIGQYANFDLLKQQAPAEAARLGIK